ncbi:hypothetical protein [Deinococcus sp.]|uniref:hypothetical protein n=1 Tax=Deinococcus sp. TaxID=47478 RepID=UPI003CC6A525
MSAPTLKSVSVEEDLRSEEVRPFKREYVGSYVYALHGRTRAQAGASGPHVRIAQNFVVALDAIAAERSCRLYSADMNLRIEQSNICYYPDFMAV